MAIDKDNSDAMNNLGYYYQYIEKNYKEMILSLYTFYKIKCI